LLSATGNAAAALIITSNGQLAGNTISGHRPPSGDHSNIIARSITSADLAPLPAWNDVGSAGQPAFDACDLCFGTWRNSNKFADQTHAGFFRDHGMVYLQGSVCAMELDVHLCVTLSPEPTQDAPIFTLPPAYRPHHTVFFRVPSGDFGNDQATLYVQASTGNVVARNFHTEGVWLDGISFRIDN
jgi:hypothetical protein